jgi:hypothetical protein
LDAWRKQTVQLISLWYRQYFQFVDADSITGLKKDVQEKLQLKGNFAPVELIEKVTNGLRLESLEGLDKDEPSPSLLRLTRSYLMKIAYVFFVFGVRVNPYNTEKRRGV